MNRTERRKMNRTFSKRLTDEQLAKLQSDANMEYVEEEIKRRMKYNEALFKEALQEAFKRQNIASAKAKALLDDMILIMQRKAAERSEQRVKA